MAKLPAGRVQAHVLDDPEQALIVPADVRVDVPVCRPGDVGRVLPVERFDLFGQVEAPVALVDHDLAWHALVFRREGAGGAGFILG